MRRAECAILAMLIAACAGPPSGAVEPAAAPPAATMEAAREIMRLEEAWGRALSARDTAFFRETLAEDFTGTGGPDVRTKAMVIAELTRGTGTVPVPRLEETQVRIFGDVAVVTGVAVYQASAGVPDSRTRFSEVWVKRAGRWQAVHGHYNAVPPRGQ